MKKTLCFLAIISFQTSLLFCASIQTKPSERIQQISKANNLLPLVALMAKIAPFDEKEAYWGKVASLAKTLTRGTCYAHFKTTRAYSDSLFPETPSLHTTCIFISPHCTSIEEARAKKMAAIKEASSTKPIANYTATLTKRTQNFDRIQIQNNQYKETSEATVSHISAEHPRVTITVFPPTQPLFSYNVGDTILTSMLPPETPFPDHDILAATCAQSDHKAEIVKVWALPQKS